MLCNTILIVLHRGKYIGVEYPSLLSFKKWIASSLITPRKDGTLSVKRQVIASFREKTWQSIKEKNGRLFNKLKTHTIN